ncbi:MAG: AbrB/MazE/SpoVT family DNA-binding domain-containing protein [Candidatus Nanopelagicaceae bacterium]|nr:AbrB/MazE/SpoVT family DNA-binding domain-containing protein [Candidatus Nanopelagicaceae bacterium]
MSIIELNVKEKGRTVLPVELQQACGFKPGDTLIVQEISEGRFIVETKERKIQSLWEKALTSNASPTTGDSLRKRSKDEAERLARLTNPNLSTGEESDKRAAALLAAVLGE